MTEDIERQRAAMAEKLGKSIRVGNIHYWERTFKGTEDSIRKINDLQGSPEFKEQFPHHRVFVLPDGEIVGALPEDTLFDDKDNLRALTDLRKELKKRGIETFNCAIISPIKSRAPVPVF